MKYLKKKKGPSVWVYILSVVAVLAIVLILMTILGKSPQEPVGPGTETESISTQDIPSTDAEEGTTAPDAGEETSAADSTTAAPGGDTQATEATEAAKATEPDQPQSTKPTTGKETEPAKKEDFTTMETPYCTLKYPEEWADLLRVTVEEGTLYTLTYYADLESGKSQELFSISFGGSQESALGTVTANGKTVAVHVNTSDFQPDKSWSEKDINIVFTMQEALNQVLDSMPIKIAEASPQVEPNLPKEDGEEMVIDTPYGELRYPSRWKDYLDLKINDKDGYSVEFRCKIEGHEPVALFVVHFGGDKGIPVGTGKDTSGEDVEIRMEVLELDLDDSWSDDDKRIAAAMQEDLNFLLSKLN